MKLEFIILSLIFCMIIYKFLSTKDVNEKFTLKGVETADSNTVQTCVNNLSTLLGSSADGGISRSGQTCLNLTSNPMSYSDISNKCQEDGNLGGVTSNRYLWKKMMEDGTFINTFNGRPGTSSSKIGLANDSNNPNTVAYYLDERSSIGLNAVRELSSSEKQTKLEEMAINVLLPTLKCSNSSITPDRIQDCPDSQLQLGDPVNVPLYFKDKEFSDFNNITSTGNYCNKEIVKCQLTDSEARSGVKQDICTFDVLYQAPGE